MLILFYLCRLDPVVPFGVSSLFYNTREHQLWFFVWTGRLLSAGNDALAPSDSYPFLMHCDYPHSKQDNSS